MTARQATKTTMWKLLKNPQMAVLCFARLGDPMAVTSILSYLFFQLQYLSPGASNASIATQAGLLVGANTIAKVLTGIFWGRLADSVGRRPVLIGGLLSSSLACAAYGFSTTFPIAVSCQFVQGAMSANIAMTRTVVAELHADSEPNVRSRALLLLVLFNGFGMLFGPLIGGFAIRQEGSRNVLPQHPFALPNLVIAGFYGVAGLGVLLMVAETLPVNDSTSSKKTNISTGPSKWQSARRFFGINRDQSTVYEAVPENDLDHHNIPLTSVPAQASASNNTDETDREIRDGLMLQYNQQRVSLRQVCTPKVVATMAAHFIITGHISTFATIWTVFLSTPIREHSSTQDRADRVSSPSSEPIMAGGVGLQPPEIGAFMTIATALAVILQMSLLPRLTERLGTIRVWRLALWLFPLVYLLAPFPATLASAHQKNTTNDGRSGESTPGLATWVAISLLMVLFMIARTGAQPPMVILINECVLHAQTRGTINALGTTVGNLARTVFPVTIMAVYGVGLRVGFVALAFWSLTVVAFGAVAASRWVAKDLDEHAVLKKTGNVEDQASV